MYKRIDFQNLGGNPIDQQSLEFMQASYREAFGAIAQMVGDKRILTGVKVVGGNVTDGWITYNGEVIKFIGGAVGPDVVVRETVNYNALFQEGNNHDEELIKTAQIGAPGTFPFSDLKPVNIGSPLGVVDMFSGQIAKIPDTHHLCDGALLNITDYPDLFDVLGTLHGGDGINTFALPNLKDRFIVGYDAADPDYNAVGKTGGEKTHQLTVNELPSHGHSTTIPSRDFNNGGSSGSDLTGADGGAASTRTFNSNNVGGNLPHENRPPYYTLAFIIRLK